MESMLKLGEEIGGARIRTLIMTDVLVGSLCYRLFDNEHSSQWELLVERKVIAPKTRTDYEETGRIKKKHIHVQKEQGVYGLKYE
jgi:hypothetical protein